jgi:Fe-S oxidoreductase
METKKGERLSDLRLAEALSMGADVLSIACPYCMLNFDDSAAGLTTESGLIEIRDIAEILDSVT